MVNSNSKVDLILEKDDINEYLKKSSIIDYDNENIIELAERLKAGTNSEVELAKKCFEYVRDNIGHSFDIDGENVTCKASDVLKYKEGLCYVKAHLLAAILRYLGIPTGFCYQKLILDDKERPYLILHGLNAIYLNTLNKWIKVDARGNKTNVDAQFCIEQERLAFPVRKELFEEDINVIYAMPSANVINCILKSKTVNELKDNLPTDV